MRIRTLEDRGRRCGTSRLLGSADHEMRQRVVRIVIARGVPTAVTSRPTTSGMPPSAHDAVQGRAEARHYLAGPGEREIRFKACLPARWRGRSDWRLRVQSNDIESYAYARPATGC